MKNKALWITIFVLLATLLVATTTAFAQEEEDLVPLIILNNTDQDVTLSLQGEGVVYYLAVAPGTSRTFTVQRLVYDQTTFACGNSASGTLNAEIQVRLNFTPCASPPPNSGEPSQEKVWIADNPDGPNFRYQYQ